MCIILGYWGCEMSKMICPFLPVYWLLHFLGTMNVSKLTLFLIWHNEIVPTNTFSAVEAHVFNNIIDETKYNEEECREIKKN